MARYVKRKRGINIDIHLGLLSEEVGYEGEYSKFENEDKTLYFATSEFPADEEPVYAYDFFGVVKSNNSNQAVRFLYTVYCEDEEVGCNYNVERIENHVKKLMESIEFKHDEWWEVIELSEQKDILSSELLRARIIEVEYSGLDENTIRRIYMEEIG